MWRGPPFADFTYDAFAQATIARLDELRLGALEERIEADLAIGRHAELVGELATLAQEHPLRERILAAQMRALYRSGRQADALAAYQSAAAHSSTSSASSPAEPSTNSSERSSPRIPRSTSS